MRLFSLLSKLIASPGISQVVIEKQDIVIRLFLYMNPTFPDLSPDCIRSLHTIFKLGQPAKSKIAEYKINLEAFAS